MRILHVITTINLGGAENHLFDLASEQKKQGHEILIVYLKGDHFWRSALNAMGIDTSCLGITSYLLLPKFLGLKKVICDFEPDLVHAHMPPAELVTRLALIFDRQIPLVISKHNDEPFAPFIKNFLLPNWVVRRASKVICISTAVERYVSNWISPSQIEKLEKIYYAVNLEKFENVVPAQDFRSKADFVIGTVARLAPQKSLQTLLKAFSIFHKGNPASQLVIVGTGGLESELKKMSQDLQIADNVIWAGKRSDIPAVLKAFDVFVLPSIYEGFGLVLLEAMAAGTAIVASNVSAIPEVLDGGRCGLLFPARDAQMLVHCLNELRGQEKRQELVTRGKERVKAFFSVKKMAQATDGLYRRVIAR